MAEEIASQRLAVVGLPTALNDHELTVATWNLVTLLLRPVAQYETGELIYPVEVRAGGPSSSHYSASAAAGGLHTDGSLLQLPPDVAVLLCLSEADEGGETVLVPVKSVHRHLARSHPALLPLLHDDQPFATDDDRERPRRWAPVLRDAEGSERKEGSGESSSPRGRYLRKYIEAGWRLAGRPGPGELTQALDAVDSFILNTAEQLTFPLRRGEVLFWRNEEFFHGRNAFTEHSRRRRLVRIYGQDDIGRPVHDHPAGLSSGQAV
ncbi:TauD/TfdA family dioxygenase [Streptomyces sp. NPDC001351]|uniref:TauD/TfdA family dioxygenase n=1 Tax=Streptomyces sp. NPDC001351 TaxID=3364564 RepID=UPI0036C4BD2C